MKVNDSNWFFCLAEIAVHISGVKVEGNIHRFYPSSKADLFFVNTRACDVAETFLLSDLPFITQFLDGEE